LRVCVSLPPPCACAHGGGRDPEASLLFFSNLAHPHSDPSPKQQDPVYKDVFATANKYHLAHAALLAAAPLASRPAAVAGAAAAGTALFCGSCYAAALTEDRAWGRGAPVGGALLIGAWAALALGP